MLPERYEGLFQTVSTAGSGLTHREAVHVVGSVKPAPRMGLLVCMAGWGLPGVGAPGCGGCDDPRLEGQLP